MIDDSMSDLIDMGYTHPRYDQFTAICEQYHISDMRIIPVILPETIQKLRDRIDSIDWDMDTNVLIDQGENVLNIDMYVRFDEHGRKEWGIDYAEWSLADETEIDVTETLKNLLK